MPPPEWNPQDPRDKDQMAWVDEVVRERGETVSLGRSGKLSGTVFPLGNVFET